MEEGLKGLRLMICDGGLLRLVTVLQIPAHPRLDLHRGAHSKRRAPLVNFLSFDYVAGGFDDLI